jgi:hypothetical protein
MTYYDMARQYGVDLVLNGHVHAYERSKPVYNYTLDACGPVHITVGCGGKPGIETGSYALDTKFLEAKPQARWCSDPTMLDERPNPTQPLRWAGARPAAQRLGGAGRHGRRPDIEAYPPSCASGHSRTEARHPAWWHTERLLAVLRPQAPCPPRS